MLFVLRKNMTNLKWEIDFNCIPYILQLQLLELLLYVDRIKM